MSVFRNFRANPKSFIHECLIDQAYSKDTLELNFKYSSVPVFLYGQEKQGYSNDLTKKGGQHVGVGWTVNPGLLMYQHTALKYPIVLSDNTLLQGARVFGHLFLVSPDLLFELDSLFQNTLFFERGTQWVTFYAPASRLDSNKTTFRAHVLFYLGIPTIWEPKMQTKEIALLPRIKPQGSTDRSGFYVYSKANDTTLRS